MNTYRQIFYQIVFATKHREQTLPSQYQEELYKYIWGVINKHNCKLYRINGMAEHIHIFSDLHPSVCLSDLVKNIKLSSSDWMKRNGLFPAFAGWQNGYGAFTYSIREKDAVIDYIKSQKEHHKHESFEDELKRLLVENGVCFDEKYFL